ncbi:hypothetical protein T552_04128 [Pneumocystis carinii B80]|uniref:Uncharacterized protein n=1 Tax=Pneumocystis carinii (strain B80) TaxID=1408658 RepID=A0A0W4ZJB6_PNEC8|nr:hypothetical protein T552_04128 [Pneumocystis carinii B80]KTW28470.1 hypothetical protein T552_04128 [Pneumocystis carinii B80]
MTVKKKDINNTQKDPLKRPSKKTSILILLSKISKIRWGRKSVRENHKKIIYSNINKDINKDINKNINKNIDDK